MSDVYGHCWYVYIMSTAGEHDEEDWSLHGQPQGKRWYVMMH